VVRFRGRPTLSFPASSIHDLSVPATRRPPVLTVNFMGLMGPNGVLPTHYTELVLRQERRLELSERGALRAWFDLFDHRLISHFYRAWEKYRFTIPFERGESDGPTPDSFTFVLLCLVGIGTPGLRQRLTVRAGSAPPSANEPRVLANINDLALLYYGGLLRQRPRSAVGLQALTAGYFGLSLQVLQFQGQWLRLEPGDRSRPGEHGVNNLLGINLIAGDRIWDVANKFRLRIGPLDYATFTAFLPDPTPVPERKAFFLLVQLVRMYIGPELDFDIQLVLRAPEVPSLGMGTGGFGAYLGWNTWVCTRPPEFDTEEAVFAGVAPAMLTPAQSPKENTRGSR
jgi:type VI secretion system protein ImpH